MNKIPLFFLHAVVSPYAVSICDTSGADFEPYQYGGIARQVKTSKIKKFVSFLHTVIQERINSYLTGGVQIFLRGVHCCVTKEAARAQIF